MTTSEVIKFLCQGQKMSLSELARRMGQTRQNLSKKLLRETLTVEEINQIAAILGGKFEQLFTLPNGLYINTDKEEVSASETIIKALWNFNEIIQNTGTVLSTDIDRLLDLVREVFQLDVVYLQEFNPDSCGYTYTNVSVSDKKYLLDNSNRSISSAELKILVESYDDEHLCGLINKQDDVEGGIQAILHYGCFRNSQLDGTVGFIDCKKNRVWTREEKDSLLRLGRTLHHIITASRLEKLNVHTQNQMAVLKTMAGIYYTVHVIDLTNDTCIELSANEYVSPYIYKADSASKQIHDTLYYNTTLDDRDEVMEFIRFDTLEERLKDKKSIVMEFRGLHLGWTQAQFIVVERDGKGMLKRVAFTTQGIDAQKRKMDQLLRISTTDELTQLNNRHAYEEDIRHLEVDGIPKDMVIAAFDVNGLKKANDEIGHAAGDELIRGTAFCITAIFGMVGKLYRTGGDEFMCIMRSSKEELADMIENFKDIQESWKGSYVKELSVSAGYAVASDCNTENIHDLLKQADKLMYQDKHNYYSSSGKERRKR